MFKLSSVCNVQDVFNRFQLINETLEMLRKLHAIGCCRPQKNSFNASLHGMPIISTWVSVSISRHDHLLNDQTLLYAYCICYILDKESALCGRRA